MQHCGGEVSCVNSCGRDVFIGRLPLVILAILLEMRRIRTAQTQIDTGILKIKEERSMPPKAYQESRPWKILNETFNQSGFVLMISIVE